MTEHSDHYVPSHLRAVTPGEQWLIDRAAESFLTSGEWPNIDKLKRDAARSRVDLPEIRAGVIVQDYLWRLDHQGAVTLSLAGLDRFRDGRPFLEKFVQVALLCRDIYLGEGDDEPQITRQSVRTRLGLDDQTIERIHLLLPSEYYLTRSGGSTPDGDWYYHVNETVALLRDVATVDEFLSVRAEIMKPKTPFAGWSPDQALSILEPILSDVQDAVLPVVRSTSEVASDARAVFVVHGRDIEAKNALCSYLEALGLHPLDWDEMVRETGTATPFTGDVIDRGFSMAQAFIVLMTPDDEARLHDELHEVDEPTHERELTCQPRPNVLFEAGMAFRAQPVRTVIVHIGRLRPISDLAGRNVVVLGGTRAPLKALADRLKIAGCPVDRAAIDNFDPNIFARLAAQTRRAKPVQQEDPLQLPRGRVLSNRPDNTPRLTVKLYDRGKEHLLEIVNRGPMELRDIEWHLPDTAPNWHILNQVLPEYPVKSLRPGQYIRVPVSVSMGGPVYVQISLRGVTDTGATYETTEQLSVYG